MMAGHLHKLPPGAIAVGSDRFAFRDPADEAAYLGREEDDDPRYVSSERLAVVNVRLAHFEGALRVLARGDFPSFGPDRDKGDRLSLEEAVMANAQGTIDEAPKAS